MLWYIWYVYKCSNGRDTQNLITIISLIDRQQERAVTICKCIGTRLHIYVLAGDEWVYLYPEYQGVIATTTRSFKYVLLQICGLCEHSTIAIQHIMMFLRSTCMDIFCTSHAKLVLNSDYNWMCYAIISSNTCTIKHESM